MAMNLISEIIIGASPINYLASIKRATPSAFSRSFLNLEVNAMAVSGKQN